MRKIGKMQNQGLREYQYNLLVGLLSSVKNKQEMEAICHTILTPSEKSAIAQRAAIWYEIKRGMAYYEIEGKFGVSPSTITKVLDLFAKNGQYNEGFNEVTKRYSPNEYNQIIEDDNPDNISPASFNGGARQSLRDNERTKRRQSHK